MLRITKKKKKVKINIVQTDNKKKEYDLLPCLSKNKKD